MGTSQLLSVPYALYAGNGTQWAQSGKNIYYDSGKVGIGTAGPLHPLHISTVSNNGLFSESSAPEGHGMIGYASSSTGKNHGLKGESASSEGVGVLGRSPFLGVAGESSSPCGYGLYGLASSMTGTTTGIMGTSLSSDGRGIIGSADSPEGSTCGVIGHSASSSGIGVQGYNDATSGTTVGIEGFVSSPAGYSGYFAGGKFRLESQAEVNNTLSMENHVISNVSYPVNAQDAATKAYVEKMLKDLGQIPNNYAGTIKDIEGNVYKTVQIGSQVWMAENLRTGKYKDGTTIPLVTDNGAWVNLTTPGYCWYNNDHTTYGVVYGAIYNWYAVNTGKLCPIGWHVPSDAEWTTLTTFLGGVSVAGGKMKEGGTAHWASPNTGATNESGFSGLPGGDRYFDGPFSYVGGLGDWWSSTEYSTTFAWSLTLGYGVPDVSRGYYGKKYGFSVRCVRDL